jgi:predicted nucleic acid-binding protein
MRGIVLDASAALTLVYPDERTDRTVAFWQSASRATLCVPQLWLIELSNALLVGERRGRLSREQAATSLVHLASLKPRVVSFPRSLKEASTVYQIATELRLTAYDAVYLALAKRTGMNLATLGTQLVEQAKAQGVVVIDLKRNA